MEFSCLHCGAVDEVRGMRGGCLKCGKVMGTASGRVDRLAMERRMMTPRERAKIAIVKGGGDE